MGLPPRPTQEETQRPVIKDPLFLRGRLAGIEGPTIPIIPVTPQ